MVSEAIRAVQASKLAAFVTDVLIHVGASRDDAVATATVLGWADQTGRGPQGTIWLGTLAARLVNGGTVSPTTLDVISDRPALVTVDARNGLGHRGAIEAVEIAAERASEVGMAAVVIRNSSHFGACGYYASALSNHGFLGVVATNAYPKVAPHGGSSPVLGTNPIGYALPVEGMPDIVGDLSTGAVAGSSIRHAIEAGVDLEDGVALDSDGQPTRDPRALSGGGVMLPIAGAKGMALGILVEVLTSVIGGGTGPDLLGSMFDHGQPAGTSHFVMAITMPDTARGSAAELATVIKGATPREGMSIRMPGDRIGSQQASAQVNLAAATVVSLQAVCATYEVEVPDFLS